MLRLALLLALLITLPARAAESAAALAEKQYREKRQAALAAQWMETRLPWETPQAFLARLLDTAREGDSRATAGLGWEFQQKGDKERARTWLSRSAEAGNRFAAYLLGLLQPPSDPAEAGAVDWMRRAADEGLADAQFEIAVRHAQGKLAALDPVAAREWYGRAAAQKYAPALCNLATMEWQGTGGPVDIKNAEEHFRAAAEAGLPQGEFGVGEVLRVQSRFADAAAAYTRAAEVGIVDADFWLGCFASQGLVQPRDEAAASMHFIKAALGGHVVSQAIAADLLTRGTGIAADHEAAAHLELGIQKLTDRELNTTIGGLYLEGRLVKRDLAKALRFFRSAAEQGQPAAQRWAGALLASGEAGERNLLEAYQWLWLAARKGQPDAESAFLAVLQAMTGDQIVEAAKRAEEYQASRPSAP